MFTFWLILFGGIALFAGIITAMDWLARRQRRKVQKSYVRLPLRSFISSPARAS